MAYYKECIGYRANAKNIVDNAPSGKKINKPGDGFVTVFAERRNRESSLGEYGGDAYPLVYEHEIENTNYRLGVVLVADGVGNANFIHPSLGRYLDARIAECGISKGTTGELNNNKLMIFLQDLYGPEIFNDNYKSVLEYALKCFSVIPADGYFAADADHWSDADNNHQLSMPFYQRDSQSLGSRIICVGLYKTAIEWVRSNIKSLSDCMSDEVKIGNLAAGLKKDLEAFAFGDGEHSFRTRTQQTSQSGEVMFSYDDAPNTDKRDRYFLAATVAAWFYIYDAGDVRKGNKGSVYAVSFNIGDARTYLINKADGVRQISIDDAFPFNDMRGFVHRGQAPKTNKEYCDGSFFARIIKSELPCALFACSDGIYETVCNVHDSPTGRMTLPYGDSHGAKDILFEKNLLEAARRSYSFDDFKRELIFTFYAQPQNVKRVIESCESIGIDAKRDDSGTASIRFFGVDPEAPVEVFKELREAAGKTSLDKLWKLLETQPSTVTPVPYSEPQITPKEQRMDGQKLQYAIGSFKAAVLEKLVAKYSDAYDSMINANAPVKAVWGIPHEDKWTRPKWKLDAGNILVVVLNNALKDWQAIVSQYNGIVPAEWGTTKLYEHVIFDEEMLSLLKQIGFDAEYKKLSANPPLTDDDLQIRLYDWFQDAFFGVTPKSAENPGFEYNSRKYIWRSTDAPRTPGEWDKTLELVRSQFKEEMAAQKREETKEQNSAPAPSATAHATPIDSAHATAVDSAHAPSADNTSATIAPSDSASVKPDLGGSEVK